MTKVLCQNKKTRVKHEGRIKKKKRKKKRNDNEIKQRRRIMIVEECKLYAEKV
jgi:hypothetical protein